MCTLHAVFVRDGRLDPAGIDPLRAAWAAAKGQGLPIPHVEIVYLLTEALSRDSDAAGALRTKLDIDGTKVCWTDFAVGIAFAIVVVTGVVFAFVANYIFLFQ
jgi:hypothetical protein